MYIWYVIRDVYTENLQFTCKFTNFIGTKYTQVSDQSSNEKCSATKEKFCAFFLKSFANGNPTPYTGTMYIVYITFNCTCPDPQATSTAKVGSPRQDLGKRKYYFPIYICVFFYLFVCIEKKLVKMAELIRSFFGNLHDPGNILDSPN